MRVDTKQHFLLPVPSGTDALCCPRHCELVRLVPLGNEKSNGGTANLVCGRAQGHLARQPHGDAMTGTDGVAGEVCRQPLRGNG
jgi:hypothetical protein